MRRTGYYQDRLSFITDDDEHEVLIVTYYYENGCGQMPDVEEVKSIISEDGVVYDESTPEWEMMDYYGISSTAEWIGEPEYVG